MVTGIKNVSGVSCHIACALQIVCHVLSPLKKALIEASSFSGEKKGDILYELGKFFETLQSDENRDAIDPSPLYQSLKNLLTSVDHDDVGDASTAIFEIMDVIRKQGGEDWKMLLEKIVLGGQTRQVIVGVKKVDENDEQFVLRRTKWGKTKIMAFPFPLVGEYNSVEQALEPQVVKGYNWDRVSELAYDEERQKCQEDDNDSPETYENEWKTTKSTRLEKFAMYLCLHLQRFRYDQEIKILSHPYVRIPAVIETPNYTTANNEVFSLKGGILHMSDSADAIEEEGHYVAVVRVDDSPSETWTLIDDESCTVLEESQVLDLLSGTQDENGRFFCGTLLVYGNNTEEPVVLDILEDLKQKAANKLTKQESYSLLLSNDPESVVGKHISIRWAKGKFYAGSVKSYDKATGKHRVKYDDGDVKDYILAKKTVEWL